MKNDMKVTDYYKSGKHTENVLNARQLALAASSRNKQARIDRYAESPTVCSHCAVPVEYSKRKNKFCSKSCSASFNNIGRLPRTAESKQKTSKSIILAYSKLTDEEKLNIKRGRPIRTKHADVEFSCPICNGKFSIPYVKRHRKTCGADDCKIQASVGMRTYQNGSRKPIWFFNPYEDKEVLLESSWEVEIAELLIANNVRWIRPPFIKWNDSTNKVRRYFPDFYLLDYDVYLDPKNPYCLTLDKEKIERISEKVTLIVGGLDVIKDYINEL